MLHRLKFVQMTGTKISELKAESPEMDTSYIPNQNSLLNFEYAYWLCSNFQNFDLSSNVTLHRF
jgi:hypothetical protein